MFISVVFNLFLWLCKQSWFQRILIKKITSIADGSNDKESEETRLIKVFIKEHKRSIVTIMKKEAKRDSLVDDQLVQSIVLFKG